MRGWRERPSRRGRRWLREGKRRAPNERESRARAALEHERVCAVREIKEAAERAHARVWVGRTAAQPAG